VTGEPELPVLYLKETWPFTWQQHRPGGCRCICRFYHDGDGSCMSAAEPGLLLHLLNPREQEKSPADATGVLVLCRPCYTAIAPLSESPT
jgi:hypothetical protein